MTKKELMLNFEHTAETLRCLRDSVSEYRMKNPEDTVSLLVLYSELKRIETDLSHYKNVTEELASYL